MSLLPRPVAGLLLLLCLGIAPASAFAQGPLCAHLFSLHEQQKSRFVIRQSQILIENLAELKNLDLSKTASSPIDHLMNELSGNTNEATYRTATDQFLKIAIALKPANPIHAHYKNSRENLGRLNEKLFNLGLKYQLTLIETIQKIDPRQMVELIRDGLFPIGITAEKVTVDTVTYESVGFFDHDLGHADRFIENLIRVASFRGLSVTEVWPLFQRRVTQLLKKIDQVRDPVKRQQLEWTLFYEIHEISDARIFDTFIFEDRMAQATKLSLPGKFAENADPNLAQAVSESGTPWDEIFKIYQEMKKN